MRVALTGLFGLVAVVIYTPMIVMVVFSFNSGKYQTLPFRKFTTSWYADVLADPQFLQSGLTSLVLALVVASIATMLAFACAYSLVNAEFWGKAAVTAVLLAPLAIPLVLIGIALRIYAVALGLPLGLPAVGVGQVIYVLPLAVLNLRNRIAQLPRSHEEAAWVLGASRLRSIVEILLPACWLSIAATLLLTFTFAFDEFIIAYFLSAFEVTLPIKIWTSLVTGFDPTINAVGTAVFMFSITLGVIAQISLTTRQSKP